MTVTIRLQKEGRRIYIMGNTYPIRKQLREIGCKFDGDRQAWWIGVTKRKEVEALVGASEGEATVTLGAREEAAQLAKDHDNILGRAKYKGRTYYIVWHGHTRRGEAHRLMFRDGSKTFWANSDSVDVIRWYDEAMTLAGLRAYAQRMQSARSSGADEEAQRNRCRGCGGPIVHAAHHRAMYGYCGSCAFDEFDM